MAMVFRLLLLSAVCGMKLGHANGATVDSLDDVVFWTGAGVNRAAAAFDFDGESTTDFALAWGFRWDGAATGRDMLNAIVAADLRLYAKIGTGLSYENALLGVGYDRNADGGFAVSSNDSFDIDGFANGPPLNHVATADPADWYREGFDFGFWHYGLSDGNPWTSGRWISSQVGASDRPLRDGDWDSWTFTTATVPSGFRDKFAQNAVIAIPPEGYADFDGDSDGDGADLLAWQRGVGLSLAAPMQGDANGDGLVTSADLAVWQTHFGSAAPPMVAAVPEPVSQITCASAMFVLFSRVRQRSRSVS
jgi:hypothetical protein